MKSKNIPGSYEHTDWIYEESLHALRQQMTNAFLTPIDPARITLANTLINEAKAYDIRQTIKLLSSPYMDKVERNCLHPKSYTDASVEGQEWADHSTQPLEEKEQWNCGRRATNIQTNYALNNDGLPVNPYFNFGVEGRGIIGRFGPNHAVDNGLLRLMPNKDGKLSLHALGIIRQDNHKPALCGGFTQFKADTNGLYHYNKDIIVSSQKMEFVEELVSGSVPLLPTYADGLDKEIADAIALRKAIQGDNLPDNQIKTIERELITHRKVKQIEQEDQKFLDNVADAFAHAIPCYAGPVLSSSRNTNSAWMETQLSWIELNDNKWDAIRGDNKFNYQFTAGDDAQQVLWHEITPDLVHEATGSHGAFFTYLLSSYLLTKQDLKKDETEALKEQATNLINFFFKEPQLN